MWEDECSEKQKKMKPHWTINDYFSSGLFGDCLSTVPPNGGQTSRSSKFFNEIQKYI